MVAAGKQSGVVRQSVFEALFVHVLHTKPDGGLADALRRVGFDLRRQQPEYPAKVWRDAVETVCAHERADQPREKAMRALGRSFIEGFLATFAGRALTLVLPMIGTEAALRRLQGFMAMGVPGLTVKATEAAPRDWRVEVNAQWALPDFDAGLIQAGLERTGSAVIVTPLERGDHRYLLSVRW